MKRKLVIALFVFVFVLGLIFIKPVDAAQRNCVVDFNMYIGYNYQPAGLKVMVDTDQAWSITEETTPLTFSFPLDSTWLHVINVFDTNGTQIWSGGMTCITPGHYKLFGHVVF